MKTWRDSFSSWSDLWYGCMLLRMRLQRALLSHQVIFSVYDQPDQVKWIDDCILGLKLSHNGNIYLVVSLLEHHIYKFSTESHYFQRFIQSLRLNLRESVSLNDDFLYIISLMFMNYDNGKLTMVCPCSLYRPKISICVRNSLRSCTRGNS